MTDLTTDYVPLGDLRPHPANAKGHDLPTILASIRRFGFVDPIIVDGRTGLILSGHGRTEALERLRSLGEAPPSGISDDWTVPVVSGWSSRNDAEAEAAVVALNRTVELGGWDLGLLVESLARLDDYTGVGYDERALDELRRKLAGRDVETPDEFEPLDLDAELDHQCPSCGYQWNG